MRVLFVSSGNNNRKPSPIIVRQAKSLQKAGIDINNYLICGKGLIGYLGNLIPLKNYLNKNNYDIVHAHFSFTGFLVTLAGAKNIVVSLMGWNIEKVWLRLLIILCNRMFWSACIVKSKRMFNVLKIKNVHIIPNGVDFNSFFPQNKQESQRYLNWDIRKKHILFAANPNRPIKNFQLTKEAIDLINMNIDLHILHNIDNNEVVYYYNASDVVVLSSIAEGSPNVVKEAMACNVPVVSTDVGDVRERFSDIEGYFVAHNNKYDMAKNIIEALHYGKKTVARNKIKYLEDSIITQKIINVYRLILNNK